MTQICKHHKHWVICIHYNYGMSGSQFEVSVRSLFEQSLMPAPPMARETSSSMQRTSATLLLHKRNSRIVVPQVQFSSQPEAPNAMNALILIVSLLLGVSIHGGEAVPQYTNYHPKSSKYAHKLHHHHHHNHHHEVREVHIDDRIKLQQISEEEDPEGLRWVR